MKRRRLRMLGHALAVSLWVSGLAYGATVQIPSWLSKEQRKSRPPAFRTIVIANGIISLGHYQLNVAFTPSGKPVCVSVSARDEA